jgi:DNA topoisomerase VI subunit B
MPQMLLQRSAFRTSRVLEFFSEKELSMQVGFPKELWPIALLKETIDNGLDACETAGVVPDIEVTVEPDRVSVRDYGPGLPVKTLKHSLNYLVRVSDKAYYVSPSRGQLGNALKCLWAAPYVAHGEAGYVEVVTGGSTHRIAVTLDRIAQQPDLQHLTLPDGVVKKGTLITIVWPKIASFLQTRQPSTFYKTAGELVLDYGAFNPHASLTYRGPDESETAIPRTMPGWRKWAPRDPTDAHWYSPERLQSLIAAYLTEERRGGRARTVREFVAEFAGLRGTAKQKAVTEVTGLSGAYLHDLVTDGDVAREPVAALLTAMQRESRAVKPAALGVLGEDHIRAYLVHQRHVEPGSLKYYRKHGLADGLPFVLELACGWYTSDYAGCGRQTIAGVNWTPALKSPFAELPVLLGEARVDHFDPVVVLVHLAMPRPDFTDRGKSVLALPEAIREALGTGIPAVTKHWKAMKRQADQAERVREREREHYLKQQQRQYFNVKEAAYRVMADAYQQAAGGLGLANARQIMYAARPHVLELTGGKSWKKSSYFTQRLLPNFIEAHPELTASWDVVFDDRGHLIEPHTQYRIGLGTLAVRGYIRRWHAKVPSAVESIELEHDCPTMGPANRYGFALFIEKEGFYPLLEAAQIAERWDLAIMSTKGMSVTAARQLVEKLSEQGVTILVCHDFDASGFSILHTLQSDTRRYKFKTRPKVVDMGLRLADVQAMDLESERVDYHSRKDPRINLRRCGATEDECHFLVRQGTDGGWTGERVELNAMTSDQFIAWLERKLAEVGVQKVIPDQPALEIAYRRAVRHKRVQAAIADALAYIDEDEEIAIPSELKARIQEKLNGSARAWDAVLWDLVADAAGAANDGRIGRNGRTSDSDPKEAEENSGEHASAFQ